jgi:hypothetical protein
MRVLGLLRLPPCTAGTLRDRHAVAVATTVIVSVASWCAPIAQAEGRVLASGVEGASHAAMRSVSRQRPRHSADMRAEGGPWPVGGNGGCGQGADRRRAAGSAPLALGAGHAEVAAGCGRAEAVDAGLASPGADVPGLDADEAAANAQGADGDDVDDAAGDRLPPQQGHGAAPRRGGRASSSTGEAEGAEEEASRVEAAPGGQLSVAHEFGAEWAEGYAGLLPHDAAAAQGQRPMGSAGQQGPCSMEEEEQEVFFVPGLRVRPVGCQCWQAGGASRRWAGGGA